MERREVLLRAAALLGVGVALVGCNHMSADGAKPEVERGGGDGGNGGY